MPSWYGFAASDLPLRLAGPADLKTVRTSPADVIPTSHHGADFVFGGVRCFDVDLALAGGACLVGPSYGARIGVFLWWPAAAARVRGDPATLHDQPLLGRQTSSSTSASRHDFRRCGSQRSPSTADDRHGDAPHLRETSHASSVACPLGPSSGGAGTPLWWWSSLLPIPPPALRRALPSRREHGELQHWDAGRHFGVRACSSPPDGTTRTGLVRYF